MTILYRTFPQDRINSFFRESLLSIFLLIGGIFLLASCKPPPEVVIVPDGERALDPKTEKLRILIHSGYLPASVVETFSQEMGIPVVMQVCDSDIQMEYFFNQSPGTYDLLQVGEGLAATLVNEKKLLPLDHEKIPNLQNLDSCFLHKPFDLSNAYTVPYLAGVVGILYNSQQVKGDIRSYDDIFAAQYTGRIAVPEDNREIVACALAQLGFRFEDLTPANLEAIRTKLTNWMAVVSKRAYPQITPQTLLYGEDVVAAIAESGDAVVVTKENADFKWVVPSVGAHLFIESFAVPTTSPHPREAQQFINFLLRPDISAQVFRQYPYYNPNQAGRELMPTEEQRCLCLLSPDFPKASLLLFPPLNSEVLLSLTQFVDSLRSKQSRGILMKFPYASSN